jgi:hypothetical protein
MRSFVVVLLSPAIDDAPGFLDRSKQPAVQTTITKYAVKALVMPVLPRTPWGNKCGIHMLCMQPVCDPLGNKLRAIVALDLRWSIPLGKQPLQYLHDIACGAGPRTMNRQPFAGVLIQHGQAFQPPPIRGLVMHKVIAPDMVRIYGARRDSCALAQRPPLPRFLHPLEAQSTS